MTSETRVHVDSLDHESEATSEDTDSASNVSDLIDDDDDEDFKWEVDPESVAPSATSKAQLLIEAKPGEKMPPLPGQARMAKMVASLERRAKLQEAHRAQRQANRNRGSGTDGGGAGSSDAVPVPRAPKSQAGSSRDAAAAPSTRSGQKRTAKKTRPVAME